MRHTGQLVEEYISLSGSLCVEALIKCPSSTVALRSDEGRRFESSWGKRGQGEEQKLYSSSAANNSGPLSMVVNLYSASGRVSCVSLQQTDVEHLQKQSSHLT